MHCNLSAPSGENPKIIININDYLLLLIFILKNIPYTCTGLHKWLYKCLHKIVDLKYKQKMQGMSQNFKEKIYKEI